MFGDDEEFIPGPSSNLASIFDKRFMEDGNLSLIYTAPKQPKTPVRSSKPSSASSNLVDLILFKSVEAYKLENGTYQNCGKAGVAVLGNEETRLYQILLYKDKLHHLCSAKVNTNFRFLNQAKNYATFYDKQNQVWSVLFSSDEDVIEFSIQVALAKYNSVETPCLMSQDLWLPPDEDKCVSGSVGDTVEFHYTLHDQESLNKLSQKIKSGKMCTKIDVSGWQQELQNIYKGIQRLFIIPSENLDDWKSVAPTCDVLFVKLTVTKVMNALVEVSQLPQLKDQLSKTTQPENAEFSNGEVTVKARGESIKDALTSSPKSAKASLISRMARMGQATLPVPGATATPSDSDETEEDQRISTKRQMETRPDLKPRVRTSQSLVQSISPTAALRNTPQPPWQPYVVGAMYPQMIGSPSDPALPVFFSEVRTHNSELRMGITRMSDKVDNVLSKLENKMDKTDNENTLLSYIDKLSQENSLFKKRLEQNYQQLTDQNKEILNILSRLKTGSPTSVPNNEEENKELSSLLAESQANLLIFKEQMSEQQEYNEQLKLKLLAKEEELNKVISLHEKHEKDEKVDKDELLILKDSHDKEIAKINDRFMKAEKEAFTLQDTYSKEISEILSTLQKEKETTQKLKEENEASFFANQELEKLLQQKNTEIDQLSITLQKHETVIEELKSRIKSEKNKAGSSDDIKLVMNVVYRQLKAQFQKDVVYDASSIHNILIDTIKAVTYQYLQTDSILKGNSNIGNENKLTNNSASSATNEVSSDRQQSEVQLQKQNVQSETILQGEYKTKEERGQMKFPLEPSTSVSSTNKFSLESSASNSSTDKNCSLESVKSVLNTVNMENENVEPSAPSVSIQPTVAADPPEKGDFETNSRKNEESKENSLKVSRGPQGDDEDSADDQNSSPFQLPPRIWLPYQDILPENSTKIKFFEIWRPQPPPPPLFDEDDNEDDWFNN